MDISVIITCFNEETNIGDCLKSLIAQDYRESTYEIIISDGGSTDNTQEIVEDYARKHSNIRLVVETRKGTAAGRNAGIKAARYEYIALIDADCEAPPDWLSTLVKHFKEIKKKDPELVAVGGTNIPSENCGHFVKAIGITLNFNINVRHF